MNVRRPIVASRFYPGSARECEKSLASCLTGEPVFSEHKPELVAGIVPHAGWIFSGATAGTVFRAFAETGGADTFILLGADHSWGGPDFPVYPDGAWWTPLGDVEVDAELASLLLDELGGRLVADPEAHAHEHSLEVQVPFIKTLFPNARIVPITVPPGPGAAGLGRDLAKAVARKAGPKRVVAVASTDLTHYGSDYEFTPMGPASQALAWVKETNDRRILDLAVNLNADGIVGEAARNRNACGPGAMAAATAFAGELGSRAGKLVAYTTSYDVMPERRFSNFVGYGGVVFERPSA